MINIYTNSICIEEKRYIFQQIFNLFLGIEYSVDIDESLRHIILEKKQKSIVLNSCFFEKFKEKKWLSKDVLPQNKLETINFCNTFFSDAYNDLPILYGSTLLKYNNDKIDLDIDIFGSAFFMLSRYEELVSGVKDDHGRFPFKESVSYKHKFIMKPLIDYYTEILYECIEYLWGDVKRKKNKTKVFLSCDVDYIKDKGVRFPGIIKRIGGDFLIRKSLKSFVRSLIIFFKVFICRKTEFDPFNTFNFMMKVSEKQGLKMAFYFIPENNKKSIDGDYEIESLEVIDLMKKIIDRNHEIGYHGSYYSYTNKQQVKKELGLLKKVHEEAGGKLEEIRGGRQHFLRWETGITEKNLEAVNMKYDSSLGYAEHIGFRCGTSKEYHFYCFMERKTLNLKIRPLVVMDRSLFDKKYMNLDNNSALKQINTLKKEIDIVNGNFSILWHNSYLENEAKKKQFEKIMNLFSNN